MAIGGGVRQQWREIAHASGSHDNMPLMDVASRIALGMAYSELRLHDLVDAYSIQLRGHLHENDAVDYSARWVASRSRVARPC